MPKSLKWGIFIAACMLLLFLAGYIFRHQIEELVREQFCIFPVIEDDVLFPDNVETQSPWETEIHSADADENT